MTLVQLLVKTLVVVLSELDDIFHIKRRTARAANIAQVGSLMLAKIVATNLIGSLECQRQKVCPVILFCLPFPNILYELFPI